MSDHIEVKALGIPRRDEEILVSILDLGERFARPVGGSVHFGELASEAVVREFREELSVDVSVEGFIGTIENRFELGGAHHEVDLVFAVTFDDDRHYERNTMAGHERETDVRYRTVWRTLPDLIAADVPLYPEGLETLLAKETTHVAPPRP